jgi:hypothetical protein
MICLRCGYCCIEYVVVIVNDPAKGIRQTNLSIKPSGERCKHLIGTAIGQFSCALHKYKWYMKTPCFAHSQIEQQNSNCRIGEYKLKQSLLAQEKP